jgi:hypothetical protein
MSGTAIAEIPIRVLLDAVVVRDAASDAGRLMNDGTGFRPGRPPLVERSETLPDIPTVAESVPSYEASAWYGVGAPKNTPPDIVDKLNKEINAGLADPKLKARLADLGSTVMAQSPADFGKLIAADTEKWAKVIRAANIKAE